MRRGFKAEAERTALQLRTELGVALDEPLDLLELAKVLDVVVRSAD